MIASALIGVAAVLLYVWQQGVNECNDGRRYTSCTLQPSPFHRRFHHWPAKTLMVLTWLSIPAIAVMLGSPQRALMFVALPGVFMCAVMPHTVDGPSMALAVAGSALWPEYPIAAMACSMASGLIHERGPIFCALYGWTPWLLLGLVAVQWWTRQAYVDRNNTRDHLVGHKGIAATMIAHKPHVDMLNEGGLLWALRGIPVLAAWQGVPPSAWFALGIAYASRLVGTDTARFLMWAAPALLMHCDPPWWFVAAHVVTFRRIIL